MKKIWLALAIWVAALIGASIYDTYAQDVQGLQASNYWTISTSGADTTTLAITYTPTSSNRIAYVCGFSISGAGVTTPALVTATLAPLIGNITQSYTIGLGNATTAFTPLIVNFNACIPAPAGTGVALSMPGGAGNTNMSLVMWGYQQ